MKSKTIWTIVILVILILIIGYFTNWFGMGKQTMTTTTTTTTPATSSRLISFAGKNQGVPSYHCDFTNETTGQVTTVSGPCPPVLANQGWVTVFS